MDGLPFAKISEIVRTLRMQWCRRTVLALAVVLSPALASAQFVADLSTTMTDSPDPVMAGSNLTYTITVTNAGPDAAAAVSLDDTLPAGTTFTSLSSPGSWTCTVPAVGAHGTVTCSDASLDVGSGVFTLTVMVAPMTANGTVLSNTATVSSSTADANPGDESDTETTTVVAPSITPIHDIQGPGASSPIIGSTVVIRGIVTGVTLDGFFVQEEDAEVDADPASSEGIFVFTSSPPPAAAAFTALVQVIGTVVESVPGADPLQPPSTTLAAPTTVQVAPPGQPLPAAVPLTGTFPDPAGPVDQLERVEHMRVSVSSVTVTGPSEGSVNESVATGTSNGRFHGVVTGMARPFREAGIQAPDPVPAGSIPPIPRWDANPERFRVDSAAINSQPALTVKSGDVVGPLVGLLDYAFRSYTILPDGTVGTPVVTPGSLPATVSIPAANDITVASFNLRRLFDTVNDPGTSDTILTAVAYGNRLAKASMAIRTSLRGPDIVGVQEVENLSVLNDLAGQILDDGGPNYDVYLVEGNDIDGLDVGFLVKTDLMASSQPRVSVQAVTQFSASELFVNPDSSTALLWDFPPLVLEATINEPDGGTWPVVVLEAQLRGPDGIDDITAGVSGWPTEGDRVRAMRQRQAESLANSVQGRQTTNPGENLVLAGDFEALNANDGFVDVMNVIAGTPVPDNQTVVPGDGVDLVNPDLVSLTNTVDASGRYSVVRGGNAAAVDHVLVSTGVIAATTARRVEYARISADYPETARNDSTTALRVSDHDPVVAYLNLGPLGPTITDIGDQTIFEDTATAALPFVVDDADTPAASLTVSGSSSDTTLVPDANIVFGGAGANRTVIVTPAPDQNGGPVTITVTVSDGTLSAVDTFTLTVTAVDDTPDNTPPTLTGVADATSEESKTLTQALTVGDAETAAADLTVVATSSNQALLPDGAAVVTGTGAARTLTLTPIVEQIGETIITVTVSDGELTTTNTARLVVTTALPPDPPTGLIGTVAGNVINFTWAAPAAGATPTFCVLEGGTSSGATTIPVINTGSQDTEWTVTLPVGAYYFRVRAANRAGISGSSNEAVVGVAAVTPLPGPPSALIANVTGAQVTAQWAVNTIGTPPDLWQIELGSAPAARDRGVFQVPPGVTIVSGALDAGEYLLRVRGVNAGGEGRPSNEILFRVGAMPACEVPEAPVLLPATVVDRIVGLTWRAPRNTAVGNYRVLVGSQPGTDDLYAFDTGPVNAFGALAPPRQYFVSVVAMNDCGFSAPSNAIRVDVGSGPPAPLNQRARVDGARVTVTWDAPPDVDGYVLEAGSAPGLSDIASIPLGAPGFVAENVPPGTYYLRVRSFASGVMSGPSGEIAVVVP